MADDDEFADEIQDRMDSDHSGSFGDDSRWEVASWRAGPGDWSDLEQGEPMWRDSADVEYVIIRAPFGAHDEMEYRQFAVYFTDTYGLAELIADVLESYGLAE